MRLFGLDISRATSQKKALNSSLYGLDSSKSLWWTVFESFAGAWQTNTEITLENVVLHPTVYACITLIANDIAKMRVQLVQLEDDGIWSEYDSPAYSPVLRKPNHYQTRIQFYERWVISKLVSGNTYVLKQRDRNTNVRAMYVLDPFRVKPMIAPDGEVFYELKSDNLAGIEESNPKVPASEIIHDRINPIYHDLCGLSPIHAAWLVANQGLSIQKNSSKFHANGASPGGIVEVPGHINKETVARLKAAWTTNYGGDNYGAVAFLSDGMTYKPVNVMSAHDAQAVEQLKWGDEKICSVYKVPPYMVGVGPPPNYNNIEALNQQYYSQCIQSHVEHIEALLDEGFMLTAGKIEGRKLRVRFDIDDLLRMDSATKMNTAKEGVLGGIVTPNEARRRFNYAAVEGGDTPYLQEQNFSLAALSRRDQSIKLPPTNEFDPTDDVGPNREEQSEETERSIQVWRRKAAVLEH